jgi:hypothetical protein
MHLKWDHCRAQAGDENAISPENLSAASEPDKPFGRAGPAAFELPFGFGCVELAKGFEPPTL